MKSARGFPKLPMGLATPTQRRFGVGGLTVLVDSDLPLGPATFCEKMQRFAVEKAGADTVRVWHHFGRPDLDMWDLTEQISATAPWAVYRRDDAWVYVESPANGGLGERVLVFSPDYREVHIFNGSSLEEKMSRGGIASLTMMPTDQVWLVQLMPLFSGCFLHAAGAVFDKRGVLFVGGTGAGKSTLAEALEPVSTVLSDDRIIARHLVGGSRIYGTWSHGDYPAASPEDAPLAAVVLLSRSRHDSLERVTDPRVVSHALLAALVKPLVTRDWTERTLGVLQELVRDARAYRLEWTGSPRVLPEIARLASSEAD